VVRFFVILSVRCVTLFLPLFLLFCLFLTPCVPFCIDVCFAPWCLVRVRTAFRTAKGANLDVDDDDDGDDDDDDDDDDKPLL